MPEVAQLTGRGSQNGKLDVDERRGDGDDGDSALTAERGSGKMQVLCPEGGVEGGLGKMPSVHAVVRRSFASNCVTVGSLLTSLVVWGSHPPTTLWLNLTLPTVPSLTHGRPLLTSEPP